MKIEVAIEGDIGAMMRGTVRGGERAVKAAMVVSGDTLKEQWRGQMIASGLGKRLSNTIRAKAFPPVAPSLKAAALVYSKASKILDPFEEGAVIRSKDGFWLAIPLSAAGVGPRGSRISPGQWEAKTGRRLRFVLLRGGKSGLLVDDGTKAPGNAMVRRKVKGGYKLSEPKTFRNRTVPIFVLVPQVTLRKRLALYHAAEQVGERLPALIVANWKDGE